MKASSDHSPRADQVPARHAASRWLLGAAYTGAFVLGACVDILRHALERVVPALADGRVEDAIVSRAVVAVLMLAIIGPGVYFGARWSGRRLGERHRRGFLALFLLTPIIVYVIEH